MVGDDAERAYRAAMALPVSCQWKGYWRGQISL